MIIICDLPNAGFCANHAQIRNSFPLPAVCLPVDRGQFGYSFPNKLETVSRTTWQLFLRRFRGEKNISLDKIYSLCYKYQQVVILSRMNYIKIRGKNV